MEADNSKQIFYIITLKNMGAKRKELQEYFKTFFEEKNLEYKTWELADNKWNWHQINSDVIKEFLTTSEALNTHDLLAVKEKIVEIDFANGDINLFLRYMAQFIINNF